MEVKSRVRWWRGYRSSVSLEGIDPEQLTGGGSGEGSSGAGRRMEVLTPSPHTAGNKEMWFLADGAKQRIHLLFNVTKIIKSDITIFGYG